jgi:gas vesicle protein
MDDYNAKISDAIAAYKKLNAEIITVNENGEEVIDTSKSKEMAAAVKKVTDEYKQQVTQWKQLEVLQDDMSGQVEHWK